MKKAVRLLVFPIAIVFATAMAFIGLSLPVSMGGGWNALIPFTFPIFLGLGVFPTAWLYGKLGQ